MKKRLITSIILVLILIPLFIMPIASYNPSFSINPPYFTIFVIFMVVFVIIASFELIRMFETEKEFDVLPKIGIILLTVGTFLSMSGINMAGISNPLEANDILKISIPLLTLILFSFLVLFKNFNGVDVGKSLTIINYIGLGASSILILRLLGIRFIVYLFLITMLTDVFAYLFGMKFGKHKMAPHISPKKSWEGAIAGTIIATAIGSGFALFYGFLFPPGTPFLNVSGEMTLLENFSSLGTKPLWIQAVIIVPITFLGTILAQIGDLVASRLKRTYGIKDFGNILPGHGGLLDRFDSILFVALFLTSIFFVIYEFAPMI